MLTIKVKTIFRYLPLFLYHAVFAVIVFTNFSIGKFFIGWDALNPEFNLSINFQRSFFALWQENYGLGALTGHGFATQLPHTMIISILSSLFPIWAVRPVFTFLCLYLGGLGFYFLARLIFYKITVEEFQKKFSTAIEYICLLAALFYILNLATVQMFYLPLEAFIVHFAALPWLFWIIFRLAGKTTRKNLVLFFIINFLASIQGFIPSLFVAYAISLSLFAFVYMLVNRFQWVAVKKSLLVLFLTFLVNAYWLLPFGYYQITKRGLTQKAYNNLMTTEDFIHKNKKYGNLENVALMKGFSFDMQELGGYVFQPWITHYNNVETKIIGYSLFVFVLVGALLSLLLIRHVLVKITAVIFLYFFASLATDSPVFSQFTQVMQALSSSYYEAFRTPFTKFALGYSLLFSLFLGLGLYILLGYSYRLLKHKVISLSVFLGLFLLLIYYAFPVFKGNLLYKKLQVDIPPAYFEVMDFFKDKGEGRIADFPQDCPEGWYGYKWGYFGSGFYWYGIKQPILARTFDVWSPNNENYYWEVVQAVKSSDYRLVDTILQKYGVQWIYYDPNLINCRTSKGFIHSKEFTQYLENSSQFKLVKTISSEGILPIKIFENKYNDSNGYIKLVENLPVVGPTYKWNNNDKAYEEYGDYISGVSNQGSGVSSKITETRVYYPFRSLFTGRRQEDLEFQVKDNGEYFSFSSSIPKEMAGATLVIPSLIADEISQLNSVNDLSRITKEPQIFLDGELIQIPPPSEESLRATSEVSLSLPYLREGKFEVRMPKIGGYYSAQADAQTLETILGTVPKNCDQFNKGTSSLELIESQSWLRFSSLGSSNCGDFDLPNLSQRLSYLVSIKSRNIEGKSLLFSIINKNSQRADLETYLPENPKSKIQNPKSTISYFVIPPMEEFAQGYTFHFDNISIGRVKTVNDLGNITVNPIPYRFLTGLKITQGVPLQKQGDPLQLISVDHPNPSYYQIQLDSSLTPSNNTTLILSQSYDSGWKAYQVTNDLFLDSWYMKLLIPFFHKELSSHVHVNNWENGWEIGQLVKNGQSQLKIVIIYLPQYLEYFGFLLLGGTLFYFVFSNKKKLTTHNL